MQFSQLATFLFAFAHALNLSSVIFRNSALSAYERVDEVLWSMRHVTKCHAVLIAPPPKLVAA